MVYARCPPVKLRWMNWRVTQDQSDALICMERAAAASGKAEGGVFWLPARGSCTWHLRG